MSTTARFAVVGGTPVLAPFAGVAGIGVVIAIRIVAFDIGEVEQYLTVGFAVVADLIITGIQVTINAGAIEMPGHVNESDIGVSLF